MAPDKYITCPEKEEVGFFCMDGLTLHFIFKIFWRINTNILLATLSKIHEVSKDDGRAEVDFP